VLQAPQFRGVGAQYGYALFRRIARRDYDVAVEAAALELRLQVAGQKVAVQRNAGFSPSKRNRAGYISRNVDDRQCALIRALIRNSCEI